MTRATLPVLLLAAALATMPMDAAADDFHLLVNSPAVNKGDDSVAPPIDFEGTSRPQGPQVDIGAYEYRYSGLHLPVIMRTS